MVSDNRPEQRAANQANGSGHASTGATRSASATSTSSTAGRAHRAPTSGMPSDNTDIAARTDRRTHSDANRYTQYTAADIARLRNPSIISRARAMRVATVTRTLSMRQTNKRYRAEHDTAAVRVAVAIAIHPGGIELLLAVLRGRSRAELSLQRGLLVLHTRPGGAGSVPARL